MLVNIIKSKSCSTSYLPNADGPASCHLVTHPNPLSVDNMLLSYWLLILDPRKWARSCTAFMFCRFATPLSFSEEKLSELSGTTLAAATAAREASITKTWQRLWPNMLDKVRALTAFQCVDVSEAQD